MRDCITVYGCYLVFQLFSHKDLYADNHKDNFVSTRYAPREKKQKKNKKGEKAAANGEANGDPSNVPSDAPNMVASTRSDSPEPSTAYEHDLEAAPTTVPKEEEEEVEIPQMSVPLTIGLLVVVTVVSAQAMIASCGLS